MAEPETRGEKRPREEQEDEDKRLKPSSSLGHVVAEHYNKREEKGLLERANSRIFYLRNFNNWTKSMLIGEYLNLIKRDKRHGLINALDIGCGKGGDLLKWKKGDIDFLVCVDIAEVSVEQCRQRYDDLLRRSHHERGRQNFRTFGAQFITADCSKTILKEKYKSQDIMFDIVSCQFAFHYCFESLEQVEVMLRNASECLRPGGYFIGTTPCSYEIVRRLKEAQTSSDEIATSFGNDVYSVSFENEVAKSLINPGDDDVQPLFGVKYNFHLEDVVDCPEFLVYFPALKVIAETHGLKLTMRKRFDEFFTDVMAKCKDEPRNSWQRGGGNDLDPRRLLGIIKALETYPPFPDQKTEGKETDYKHASTEVTELKKRGIERDSRRDDDLRIGTLSSPEWDAATMYVVFAFQKVDVKSAEARK